MMRHMNGKCLTVVANVKAMEGKSAEVRRELLSLVEPSRKDAGCIQHDLHQSTENSALFLFVEKWESKGHLDRHLSKPDLQAVLARVGQLVAESPTITLWEKIA